MLKSSLLLAALGCTTTTTTVSAFSNTLPIIAWSNHQLDSLSLLQSPPPTRGSAYKSSTIPQQQPLSHTSDLCTLDLLLLVSAPGLHISDLGYLPAAEVNPVGLKASFEHAQQQGSSVLSLPYAREANAAQRVAERFVKECGAVVQLGSEEGERGIWQGEKEKRKKVLRVHELAAAGGEQLGEWELVGQPAREGRRALINILDQQLSPTLLSAARANLHHLIILTSLPSSSLASFHSLGQLQPKPKGHQANLKKRQWVSEEEVDEGDEVVVMNEETEAQRNEELQQAQEGEYSSSSKEFDFDTTKPLIVEPEAFKPQNHTSIFEVPANAGLLKRYVFFTPPLIFGLLISLLLLIPVVLIGSQTLTSVQTLQGLEGKMVGGVSGVAEGKSG